MKQITIEDFVKLSLSQAVWQVAYDIKENPIIKDVPIMMPDWGIIEKGKICSVCLGGAAILSFPKTKNQLDKLICKSYYPEHLDIGKFSEEEKKVASTFNNIRWGFYNDALRLWNGSGDYFLVASELRRLHLSLSHAEDKNYIVKSLHKISEVLEKHNL